MMLRGFRWGSGPRDAQSKGMFGTLLGRAGLHSCLLCGVTQGETLTITLSHQQIDHKLISSWISVVTMKDTRTLTSAPTTAVLVSMATLTNAQNTLQICNMPFLARVTCTLCTYRCCSLEEQWFVI